MTESEKMQQMMRSISLGNIPQLKEDLLGCPVEEQELRLSWLRSCGLTEPCSLKSSVTDEAVEGEAIRFNNAIIFFPDRAKDGVFKIGNQIIEFNNDRPSKFKSGDQSFEF